MCVCVGGGGLTVVDGFVRDDGRARVEVALQRVHLAAQDVTERLHLRQLLLQPAASLETCKRRVPVKFTDAHLMSSKQ